MTKRTSSTISLGESPRAQMIIASVSLRYIYFTSTSKEDFQGMWFLVGFFFNTFKLLSHGVLACIIHVRRSYLSVLPHCGRESAASFWVFSRFVFLFDFQQLCCNKQDGLHFGLTFGFIMYSCVFPI